MRERGRIIWLSALCLDLDFSIQPSKSKKKKIRMEAPAEGRR